MSHTKVEQSQPALLKQFCMPCFKYLHLKFFLSKSCFWNAHWYFNSFQPFAWEWRAKRDLFKFNLCKLRASSKILRLFERVCSETDLSKVLNTGWLYAVEVIREERDSGWFIWPCRVSWLKMSLACMVSCISSLPLEESTTRQSCCTWDVRQDASFVHSTLILEILALIDVSLIKSRIFNVLLRIVQNFS